METPYGFRIVGSCREPRRLVDASAAFAAYAECDKRVNVHREGYLSAFQFGDDFRNRDDGWQVNVKGFNGICWSPFVWWDIDRENNLQAAVDDSRKLCAALVDRYQIDGDDLLTFFSGSKGFHVGLPAAFFNPEPSVTFNRTTRRFAEHVAELARIEIDTGIYDKVRAFRAPNSRHPKTGRFKRQLEIDDMLYLKLDAVLELAEAPKPFDLPNVTSTSQQAVADWNRATEATERQADATQQRHLKLNGSASLNRATLEFMRDGAANGDRHRMLYSCARNLGDFGCSFKLAHALLSESALNSGLQPKDVRRQIECGLNDSRNCGRESE